MSSADWDQPPPFLTFGDIEGIPPNSFSAVAESSRVVKSGQGLLYGCTMTNANAATRFLQGFDAQTLPANGAIPVFSIHVPTATEGALSYVPTGRLFRAGIILAASTTQNTLTLAGADHLFDSQYV